RGRACSGVVAGASVELMGVSEFSVATVRHVHRDVLAPQRRGGTCEGARPGRGGPGRAPRSDQEPEASIAPWMSSTILFHAASGSRLPEMMPASVTPQKLHTEPISGIDGIGTASAPTSR